MYDIFLPDNVGIFRDIYALDFDGFEKYQCYRAYIIYIYRACNQQFHE